ncbi:MULTISPECIES: S4 domain-containing protein YaaA [Bacillaceae]|uniref:S4 domain-containing protein YaaA n=1 Tax=Evansella alkalicola TaxID=745819 RepID=A0ABS6JYX5_9BACI|nr:MULTISPECIES: S4 domain-containing protein YaaA [Bacillaceae]MBU9722295.1 S4 domain-containing protein YaaA [Bacillus alkalicola]
MEQTLRIKEEYITLGQVLKEVGLIGTGGAAKWFLQENPVLINETEENRRGKKLYPGDRIDIEDFGTVFIEEG